MTFDRVNSYRLSTLLLVLLRHLLPGNRFLACLVKLLASAGAKLTGQVMPAALALAVRILTTMIPPMTSRSLSQKQMMMARGRW